MPVILSEEEENFQRNFLSTFWKQKQMIYLCVYMYIPKYMIGQKIIMGKGKIILTKEKLQKRDFIKSDGKRSRLTVLHKEKKWDMNMNKINVK